MKYVIFCLLVMTKLTTMYGQSWQWAKNEKAYGKVTSECNDLNGNVYIAGTTATNAVIGPFTVTVPFYEGLLVKYDQFGTALWVKNYSNVISCAVTTDNSGNVFLAGTFVNTMVVGTTTLNSPSQYDIFLIKHDAAGNVLWVRTGTGSGQEYVNSVCTDASGNCFIVGAFTSNLVSFGSLTLTNGTNSFNYHIVKYDPNGNELWARANQGGLAISNDVAADNNGDVVMIGNILSPTLVIGNYTFPSQNYNFYVTKYSAAGTLIWAISGGGSGQDFGNSISLDPSGDLYFCGGTSSPVCTIGSYTFSTQGNLDMYLAKYSGGGNFQWAKHGGGAAREEAWSIASDAAGVYVVGNASSPSMTIANVTLNAPSGTYSADAMFMAEYNSAGNPVNAILLTGGGNSSGDVSLFGPCNLYLGGALLTPTVIIGSDTLANSTPSTSVYFVAKYNRTNSAPIINISGNLLLCPGQSTTLTASGAQTYTWMNGSSGNILAVTPSVTSTYFVLTASPSYSCNTIAKAKVVVVPMPTLSIAPSATLLCSGQSATLTGSGATSYTWSNNANTSSITVAPIANQNYSLFGASAPGCTATVTQSVNVLPNPAVQITPPGTTVCAGQKITISATGATSYSWNTGVQQFSIIATPSITINYSVIGTNTNGCSGTSSVTIFVMKCLGLQKFETESIFSMYPNPVSDGQSLVIRNELKNGRIEIRNLIGEIILSLNAKDGVNKVDCSGLYKGIYVVVLSEGSQVLAMQKLVIQ